MNQERREGLGREGWSQTGHRQVLLARQDQPGTIGPGKCCVG